MTHLSLIAMSGMGVFAVILLALAWLVRRHQSPPQHLADETKTCSVHDKIMSLHGSDLDPKLQDAFAEYALRLDRQLVAGHRN